MTGTVIGNLIRRLNGIKPATKEEVYDILDGLCTREKCKKHIRSWITERFL